MQQGGIKDTICSDDVNALDEYIRGELLPQLNPEMGQVLQLTKRLLEDLEMYHVNMANEPDLDPYARYVWERDAKSVTKALMALRKVADC